MLTRLLARNNLHSIDKNFIRLSSTSKDFKLVVVGGGTGGLSIANRFSRSLGGENVALVEPSDTHYYQPLWTFVGAGIEPLEKSSRKLDQLLNSKCKWFRNEVDDFYPDRNSIKLADNTIINYEYLVVATGIQMDLDKVKGLRDALTTDKVCSNYMVNTVTNTWKCFQNFKGGNALFTFPNTPIKCAGAPQKIMYLFDDYLRRNGKRENANITFNSALGVIFGVKKYADALSEIVKERNLNVNFKHNLIEIKPDKCEAIFEKLETGEKVTFNYDLLHVTPPQRPSPVLKPIADSNGFVEINKDTLQHVKYANIFSLGDCSSAPTSRTAAACAAESSVLAKNLSSLMDKKSLSAKYNGYTSCPLITSNKTVILAEFDYDLQPMETFPINQGKQRKTMYFMTKDIIPFIYWKLMTKGYWNGPGFFRKLMHFGFTRD